jgi:hypothetical protein
MAKDLSADQLRFGLFFWDRIAWPRLPLLPSDGNADIEFLISAGVLLRPEMQLQSNLTSAAKGLAESYFQTFQKLEQQEPGRRSLSANTEADIKIFLGDRVTPDRGITVSLHRAIPIPIPSGETPLNELLEFKLKRDSELLALRVELDEYKRLITGSTDRAEAFATQRDRIDGACKELLVVSREMKLSVRVADMSIGIAFNGSSIVGAAAAAVSFNLIETNSFLTSLGLFAASCIKLKNTFGTKKTSLQTSPFRYVHHLHEKAASKTKCNTFSCKVSPCQEFTFT